MATSRRPQPATPPGGAGSPADVQLDKSGAPATSPTGPHERDESQGMTGSIGSHRMRQGSDDLRRGVRDTSRADETDQAYQKLKE